MLSSGLKERRLDSETGERHQAAPKRLNARAISDLTLQNDRSVRL